MAWLSHPWVREQAAGLVEENMRKSPRIKDELEQQQLKQQQALSQMGRKRATAAAADAEAETTANKERDHATQVSSLLEMWVWQPHVAVDDAFTTLMQWLHHKMMHPYNPVSARTNGKQHARPSKGPAVTTERRQS
jgi:biotin carboxyl carrier protein